MYTQYYLQARDAADKIRQGSFAVPKTQQEEGFVPRKGNRAIDRLEAEKAERAAVKTPDEIVVQYMAKMQENTGGPRVNLPRPKGQAQGYPMPIAKMEAIIAQEASARGIDPEVAIQIFRHEGAGAYQSQIARTGSGTHDGKEASFGPFQLFTGGGLGNEYEQMTGRNLLNDNTEDGITTQIRFALDKAAEGGWGPWYGRQPAGIGVRDGLSGAKPIGNWKEEA